MRQPFVCILILSMLVALVFPTIPDFFMEPSQEIRFPDIGFNEPSVPSPDVVPPPYLDHPWLTETYR